MNPPWHAAVPRPRQLRLPSCLCWTFATTCLLLFTVTPTCQWPSLRFWSTLATQPAQTLVNNSSSDLSLARVLNFFPVPVEEECLSEDKRRRGICMNTYECRIQQGKSHGPCALGFGVCCIFTTSCGGEALNNLTYVTSPEFPNLLDQPMNCSVVVKKIDPQISQFRIDFVHFNIGQPNRRTGQCDEDIMEVTTGEKTLELCGVNNGQHVYIDAADGPLTLNFRMPNNLSMRMWEMSVIQLPFEQRAPAGCMQYFRSPRGTLKTLNYAPNGRYLADQDYLLCVRQESGMCSVAYTPCTNDSFRVGQRRQQLGNNGNNTSTAALMTDGEGSGTGPVMASPLTGQRCDDRVLIPCDFEEFITPGNDGAGICDLEHCGTSLCESNELDADGNCRVETSATPFHIRVAFGPGEEGGSSPENSTGMCLNYEQLPCVP